MSLINQVFGDIPADSRKNLLVELTSKIENVSIKAEL